METYNASKIIVDRSVPAFIKDDFQTFELLLNAYYEWLETEKNSLDISKNLKKYRLFDETLEEFKEHFFNEYIANFPSDSFGDKSLFLKFVKTFFAQKGTEASYKLLFKLLFNDNIEIYYPKKDILRASHGKWYVQRIIKFPFLSSMNLSDFLDKRIYGVTSGASAVIQSAIRYTDRGLDIVEISIEDINGSFVDAENIRIEIDEDTTVSATTYKLYSEITIATSGSRYNINDVFNIRDATTNSIIATGTVRKVSKGPVTGVTIVDGGVGYNGQIKNVTKFYGLPINYTWDGMYLPDQPISGGDFPFSEQPINFNIDSEILVTGSPDIISISDNDGSYGYGADALVYMVDHAGTILQISLQAGGQNYGIPSAEVISGTGSGAILDVSGGGGAISRVSMNSFPIKLQSDVQGSTVYPDFSNVGDGSALGSISTTKIGTFEGRYLNTDGFLSSDKKLQDNYYYQDYSYVIKSGIVVSEWKSLLEPIIHPAGTLAFGVISIKDTMDSVGGLVDIIRINTIARNTLDNLTPEITLLDIKIG